jgi:hypothetical protein
MAVTGTGMLGAPRRSVCSLANKIVKPTCRPRRRPHLVLNSTATSQPGYDHSMTSLLPVDLEPCPPGHAKPCRAATSSHCESEAATLRLLAQHVDLKDLQQGGAHHHDGKGCDQGEALDALVLVDGRVALPQQLRRQQMQAHRAAVVQNKRQAPVPRQLRSQPRHQPEHRSSLGALQQETHCIACSTDTPIQAHASEGAGPANSTQLRS